MAAGPQHSVHRADRVAPRSSSSRWMLFAARSGPALDPKSGTGGFALMAESLLPADSRSEHRAGQGSAEPRPIPRCGDVRFTPFRLRPGDDASCLNLYQPRNPRILAPTGDFLSRGRFSFQESLAGTAGTEAQSLAAARIDCSDGAIPAIADANSMTYVLHRKLGEDVIIDPASGHPIRLRLVAALADSIFQGELLISETNFLRVFPDEPGYRFFLIDPPPGRPRSNWRARERALRLRLRRHLDRARLAAYHRVENTYISTFQTLGALGLLLGTVGLAAVLARNVLERRRELALSGGGRLPAIQSDGHDSGRERAGAGRRPGHRHGLRSCRDRSRHLVARRTCRGHLDGFLAGRDPGDWTGSRFCGDPAHDAPHPDRWASLGISRGFVVKARGKSRKPPPNAGVVMRYRLNPAFLGSCPKVRARALAGRRTPRFCGRHVP